jgi:lipoprotein-releasing system permease protein
MNIKLINTIALSLLLARWKQTLIDAVGVTFSITMFIALLSFMAGLNDLLDGLLLNRTAHVRLYNEIQPNKNQPINNVVGYAGSKFITVPLLYRCCKMITVYWALPLN